MTNSPEMSKLKLALHIGRAKDLLSKGKTIAEIAEILNVPEVQVREYKEIIDQAEANQ